MEPSSHAFPLSFLFSPHANPPTDIVLPSFSRLAILGPLPPSTLFHFALNYVQHLLTHPPQPEHGDKGDHRTEEAAISKEADHSEDEPYILILTPSRRDLHSSLVEENESFLATHGGDPSTRKILSKNVEFKYLETSERWTFFLAGCCSPEEMEGGGSEVPRVMRLRKRPDAVLVWGLSAYLYDDKHKGAGVESYGSLLASLLSTFSSPETRIVIFDNPADEHASLPLLPTHITSSLNKKKTAQQTTRSASSPDKGKAPAGQQADASRSDANNTNGGVNVNVRRMSLLRIAEYFCDVVGSVSQHTSMGEESGQVAYCGLRVYKSPRAGIKDGRGHSGDEEVEVMYRVEVGQDEVGYSGRDRLRVVF